MSIYNFANNLRRLMSEKGIIPKELARVASVTPQAVYHWLKGRKYPSLDVCIAICNEYKVTFEDLFEEE